MTHLALSRPRFSFLIMANYVKNEATITKVQKEIPVIFC